MAVRNTVLVLESDRGIRDLVETALQAMLGVRVVAGSEQEALGLAQSVRPDLVLLEVWASPRRGVDVVRQLRADSSLRNVPILALVFSHEGRIAALRAGCDDVVGMPFHLDELTDKVQKYLSQPTLRSVA